MNFEIIDYQPVYKNEVLHMMLALYEDSIQQQQMSPEKIQKTLSIIPSHPQIGKILLFKQQGILIGYALLINYWSNEYGGNILYIDELYVKSDYRSLGIGSAFFSYIEKHVDNSTVALCLETTPQNKKAQSFYKKNKFEIYENIFYFKELN